VTIYMVGDDHTDVYGFFSTRALAEAYIQRQRDLNYSWWDGLVITEWRLDEAKDVGNL
jgi:hypothetical protein